MATIDDVRAAYQAVYRKRSATRQATATANAIDAGTTTLDKTIKGYIDANIETTQPGVAVYQVITGKAPTSAQLDLLAPFDQAQ